MALTKEQIRIMDSITGIDNSTSNYSAPKTNTLSDDDIKRMDEITGLAQYKQVQKPTLKDELINEDPDRAKQYETMGPISIYEGAKREALENNGIFEFSGSYNNVIPDEREQQKINAELQEKIKKQERDKRVNEGTANIIERIVAYRDRLRDESEKEKQNRKTFLEDDPVQIQKRLERQKQYNERIAQFDEAKLTSEIGFLENIIPAYYYGTGVGDLVKGAKEKQIRLIKDKMVQGKPIYQSELDTFKKYYESEKEKQIRGYSFGGKLAEGLGKSLGFATDFILPTKFLRTTKLGSVAGNAGLKAYLGAKELGAGAAVAKGAAKTTEYGINALLTSAVTTAINAPLRLFPEYQERMLGNEAKLTDVGNLVFQESQEKPATAFMKSLGGLYIAYLSENLGGAIGAIGSGISKGVGAVAGGTVGRLLSKNPALNNFMIKSATELSKRYEALRGLPVVGKSTGWIKDTVHFDGFLEEMGEEVIEDVLRLTAGIDNQERNIENYKKAIFKTPEEWAVTAGVIMLQGAGLSATSYAIARNMANSGANEQEISDVLVNTSEQQKKEILDEQIIKGMVSITDDVRLTDEDKRRSIEIKDNIKQKLVDVGVSEKEAHDLSVITSAMYERYGTRNDESREKFNDYINRLQIKYNIPVQEALHGGVQFNQEIETAGAKENEIEEAKREWQEKGVESKYFKRWFGDSKVVDENGKPLVVYHGTLNKFEAFDKNTVGDRYSYDSRGFFFTSAKNIAEDYATSDYDSSKKGEVMPVYISAKTPLIIDENFLKKEGMGGVFKQEDSISFWDNYQDFVLDTFDNGDYDGIIINDGDTKMVVAFEPEQIKSVNNRGTFDTKNPNIYYQPFSNIKNNIRKSLDKMKTIMNGKKVSEVAPEYEFFNLFDDELKDIQNYYIDNMPDSFKSGNTRGTHIASAKTIYINYDAIGDDFIKFIGTLAHEAKHASQEKEYKKAKSKLIKTVRDLRIIKNYKDCQKVNKNRRNYYEKNKKVLNKIFYSLKGFEENKKEEYLKTLDNKEYKIYDEYTKLYYKYYNTNNEVEARKAGDNAKRKAKRIDRGLLEKAQASYGRFREWNAGTRFGDKSEQNRNRGNDNELYYQEITPEENEQMLMAGFKPVEVAEKLEELYGKQETITDENRDFQNELMAKIHVLEDAFEVVAHPEKFTKDVQDDIMLNTYYIMNDEKIPESYIEADKMSLRSYNDYKKAHDERIEQEEKKYRGYFTKQDNVKPLIVIMKEKNASTVLHEFSHMFLDLLNEMASVNPDARVQLEAVNKWLNFTGEYTAAQHEKFANNFVAYLYKGKAPNSKLKTVFENFREWLKSVYKSVFEIPDFELSEEVEELFNNIFGDDKFYEESKQASELLDKVKAKAKKEKAREFIEAEELDDVQKRHKTVSYEILSAATGKSEKYLKTIFEGNSKGADKKREAIQKLVDEVGDKITISGGMQDNWKEFYSDTGVGYENDILKADWELANAAYETILNKSYKSTDSTISGLDDRARYYENAIDEADRQYKLLFREYKKGNRNVATAAICDWIDGLDTEIKKDYEDRFIYDSSMVDREANIDKFDKAKRAIIKRALEVQNQQGINKNEEYKEVVKEIMKNLNFLNPADKARLTANILDISSTNMLMARINQILDVARTMEEVSYRRRLEAEIHKELQGTKNVKKSGKTVGKYDYRSNKIFEKLRELDKLTPEKADELRLANKRFIDASEKILSNQEKLFNKFLSYKAGGRTFEDSELMKELYDEIVRIKLIGKSAKSELELQEKLENEKDVDELLRVLSKKKEAKWTTKMYNSCFGNIESTINLIFNKKIKEKYATEILYSGTQASTWSYNKKNKLIEDIAKNYNVPKWKWDWTLIKYLSEKFTFDEKVREYNDGELVKTRLIPREMTKLDILNAYIQAKNEVGYARLINQFGEETLDSMFDELSIQDVKLADLLMNSVQENYNLINQAYIRRYGIDLPKVSNYFPFTPERQDDINTFNEYQAQSYGFIKSRSSSEIMPMDFHNPIEIVFSHIDNVSKFVFMSESLDRANKLFIKKEAVKKMIVNKYGKSGYKTLEQELANISNRKQAAIYNGFQKVIDRMTSNWLLANVIVKPIVGLKQLLSASNYSVDMPYMTWQKGFLKSVANYKDTIDYMMNIPYLKARFGSGFSNEALKQEIESSAYATTQSLKNFLTLNIRLGDIGAIIFGGKPYIDYLIKEKGLEEQEAIKQFVLSTNRSQQSSEIASLSNFQVDMTRNPLLRIMASYRNAQQQYVRMCGDAIVSVANGDMTKSQAAKTVFNYGFFQPFLFALATSGSLLRGFMTGDWDDLLDDIKLSIFNLGSDSVAIFGDIYKYVVQGLIATNKFTRRGLDIPVFSEIIDEVNKISKEDVELSDWLHFIGFAAGKLGIGVDVNQNIGNSVVGAIGDVANGDVLQGALRAIGMTEKRAKRITGND